MIEQRSSNKVNPVSGVRGQGTGDCGLWIADCGFLGFGIFEAKGTGIREKLFEYNSLSFFILFDKLKHIFILVTYISSLIPSITDMSGVTVQPKRNLIKLTTSQYPAYLNIL
jgi:hypothetical protein